MFLDYIFRIGAGGTHMFKKTSHSDQKFGRRVTPRPSRLRPRNPPSARYFPHVPGWRRRGGAARAGTSREDRVRPEWPRRSFRPKAGLLSAQGARPGAGAQRPGAPRPNTARHASRLPPTPPQCLAHALRAGSVVCQTGAMTHLFGQRGRGGGLLTSLIIAAVLAFPTEGTRNPCPPTGLRALRIPTRIPPL